MRSLAPAAPPWWVPAEGKRAQSPLPPMGNDEGAKPGSSGQQCSQQQGSTKPLQHALIMEAAGLPLHGAGAAQPGAHHHELEAAAHLLELGVLEQRNKVLRAVRGSRERGIGLLSCRQCAACKPSQHGPCKPLACRRGRLHEQHMLARLHGTAGCGHAAPERASAAVARTFVASLMWDAEPTITTPSALGLNSAAVIWVVTPCKAGDGQAGFPAAGIIARSLRPRSKASLPEHQSY